MTMQIGMVGTDGIVLASDTWWSRSPLPGIQGTHHGWGGSKIVIDEAGKVAVSCARDKVTSARIAERIISELPNEPLDRRSQRIREIGIEESAGRDIECLVAYAGIEPSLHLFQHVNQGSDVVSDQVITFARAGDDTNAALFWVMQYYRPGLTVRQLMGLAAHVVITAGELNSAMIRGLEIVYSDQSGFHRLSKGENLEWEARARGWDKSIGELILGNSA